MHSATELAIVSGIFIVIIFAMVLIFIPHFEQITIKPGELSIIMPPKNEQSPDELLPGTVSPESKMVPVAKISAPSIAKRNIPITITAESSFDPDGGKIMSYLWKLDNGNISRENSIIVSYDNAGVHVIDLEVTDDEGQKEFARHFIEISID